MAEKKFYWLKLKEDFFRQKEIKKLRKIAGGDTYTIIYLKMQLLSLRNEGLLYYEGTEDTFEEQLSLEIDEDIDNVKITLAFLFNNNLIEEINNNEFFLNKASECIGKEGSSAKRMRKLRENQAKKQIAGQTALQCDADVTDSDKNVTTEIERRDREKREEIERRDREKREEIETEIDNKSSVVVSNIEVFKYFEQCGFIMSAKLMEFIASDIEVYGPQWLMDAADACVKRGKLNNYGYLKGILQNWQTEGRKEDSNGRKDRGTGDNREDIGQQLRDEGIGFSTDDL